MSHKDQVLNYAVMLFILVGASAVIDGLLLLFVDERLLFLPEDELYIGLNAEAIIAYNQELYTWVAVVYRLWGTFLTIAGGLVIAVAGVALKNKERWAWYTLALTTVPSLLSWIIFVWPFDSYFFPTLSIFLGMCIIALGLSYRPVFVKNAHQL